MMALSSLNQRRWRNFKANRRAFWALILFSVIYGITLCAEVVANDKPLLVQYQGEWHVPFLRFYPETAFGGAFKTEAKYKDPEVKCLILSGGSEECWDAPDEVIAAIDAGTWANAPAGFTPGRIFMAPIPYSFTTIVSALTSIIGITAGAIQGYFGGLTDLIFQRIIEIWAATPQLYVIIIVAAVFSMHFWLLVFLMVLFGWTSLIGVVRAEFLRARNFEYVRAAKALGVPDRVIIFRHVLPNAMVATLTMLPFIVTGTIGALTSLDFLGFGLPASAPSLGEMTQQAKQNLQAPWLGFTAFFTFAIMLSLLVFIFEGIRDAFDPRKTFR